jgi:3-hydroxybutyryl-CoA dehydratase
VYGSQHLYYEDIEIGQTWTSPPRVCTAEDVRTFAKLTGDFNPIHVNDEFAATTPYGRTIAHGLLCLSLASGMGVLHPPMRTIAFVELRSNKFTAPVFPGDTLIVHTTVKEKERRGRGRRGQVTWQRQLVNQEGKVVQEGISVTLVEAREPVRS